MWSKMANFADRFIAKFIPESFPLSFVHFDFGNDFVTFPY